MKPIWRRERFFPERLVLTFLVLLVSWCLVGAAATDPLDSWNVRRQLDGSGTAAIEYGNDRFVIAAIAGPLQLLVSTNGADWRAYLPPEVGSLASLKFANGNFLLVISRANYPGNPSTYGTALYSSLDGVSWILRRFTPSGGAWVPVSSVGGGNGLYVLASSDLSVSSDLVNWKPAVLGSTGIQEFAAGRSLLIGTPWWGTGLVLSTDGLTWEYISPPGGFHYYSVGFANGRFAAFSPAATDGSTPPAVAVSPYGYQWSHNVLVDDQYTNCTRLVSGNDHFFLLSSGTNQFYSSADALQWKAHSFGTNAAITDVAFGANTYVAVGDVILQSAPVTNSLPVAARLSIRNVPGILIQGPVGQSYQIEFSESLSETNFFVPLTNVVSTTSPFLWLDTAYTNPAPRFYRALSTVQPAGKRD